MSPSMLKVPKQLPLYHVYKYSDDFYMSTHKSIDIQASQYYTILCKIEITNLPEDWVENSNVRNIRT